MYCSRCNIKEDVSRSEYVSCAGNIMCRECHSLMEDVINDLSCIWDEDLAEERKYDYYEVPDRD